MDSVKIEEGIIDDALEAELVQPPNATLANGEKTIKLTENRRHLTILRNSIFFQCLFKVSLVG